MEDHLTDDARRALELAHEEAQSLNHRVVGPEHLLLGLVRMVAAGSVSVGVEGLRRLLARRKENSFREKLLKLAAATYSATAGGGEPQVSSEMQRLLEHASWRAEDNGRDAVGTEHLLLGVFRVTREELRALLSDLGITYLAVCRQLVLLGALPGPIDPDDAQRQFPTRRYGERVIISNDRVSIVLQRMPELLPPTASMAFNRLDDDRSYVRISEGLDAAEYVRQALERGPIE